MSAYKHLGRLYFSVVNSSLIQPSRYLIQHEIGAPKHSQLITFIVNSFCTSPRNRDLMEFFDHKDNWGGTNVPVGRAWKLDELRIKSNSDLHKLWFVLLKEKNMLLTMEHEYKDRFVPMPSPERIHKVRESMENIETVVKERNRAYFELETGETGERMVVEDTSGLGLPYRRKFNEHTIPKENNLHYQRSRSLRHKIVLDPDVVKFVRHLNEKKEKIALYKRSKLLYDHVCGLFRRFENIDEEAVKAEYPEVDIEKAKKDKKSRGPRVNMY